MNLSSIFEREKDSIYQTYKRYNIAVARGEGVYLYDIKGNKYLDFLAGIAVNALGNAHPKIVEAIKTQAEKYVHVSNYFYQEPQVIFAEKIKKHSGFKKVFFANTGAESLDGSIKLARKWGNAHGKKQIIAFSGGFHGRSLGTLSLMDKPLYKEGMGPFLPNCSVIKYNSVDALKSNITKDTAAILLEIVQGEGGISMITREFAEAIKELQKTFGFLLIIDEVQAGVGRTGKFFAYEHFALKPDIVTVAKGIGGGMPIAAILCNERTSDVWSFGMHGTTYGGNPIACATGSVVLDELENGLLEHVNEVGEYLHEKLLEVKEKHYDKVLEVRGIGLMKGLLMNFEAASVVEKLLERKIITNAASGNVLRLVPPLIIEKKHIDIFAEELLNVLNNM